MLDLPTTQSVTLETEKEGSQQLSFRVRFFKIPNIQVLDVRVFLKVIRN